MFEQAKSSEWYNSPTMMGEIWARENVEFAETILTKYSSDLQRLIGNYAIPDSADWNHWCNTIHKSYIGLVKFALRRVDKQPLDQTRRQVADRRGLLKTRLDHVLEYLTYTLDQDNYIDSYSQGVAYLGIEYDEAVARLHRYISKHIMPKMKKGEK